MRPADGPDRPGDAVWRDGERDPRVPDGSRWNFAAGAIWQFTPPLAINGAFSDIAAQKDRINRPGVDYPGARAQAPIQTLGPQSNENAIILALGAVVQL